MAEMGCNILQLLADTDVFASLIRPHLNLRKESLFHLMTDKRGYVAFGSRYLFQASYSLMVL